MRKFIILITLIFFDYISKKIIFNLIDLNNFYQVLIFFDLAHIHNYGISFGLFSNIIPSYWLASIGLFFSFFIFYMFVNSKKILEKWGLLLVFSGALSNIFDRVLNGYVLDFIYLHYKDFYWPAFNFADIYISIGILLILFQYLTDRNRGKK